MITAVHREDKMSFSINWRVGSLALVLAMMLSFSFGLASTDGETRAAWLFQRADLENSALTGMSFQQAGLDYSADGGGGYTMNSNEKSGIGGNAGITMLASAVLPGAGEALMGHKRGYLMMALDIFAWTQVVKYGNEGEDLRQDYYDFADAHYTDANLVEGYNPSSTDIDRGGEGAIYFPDVGPINDESELENLPLYVTVEADRREYYENLGKWDQFIFGWDDYQRASIDRAEFDYEPTMTISDIRQPWVSVNREKYRTMRIASNDAYKNRDRWLYVNIGMRVFSVMQVAFLQGLLGGGEDANYLEVSGHQVEFIAQPYGFNRGTVAAKVSF